MEVTIISKERNHSGQRREPQVVSQETWQNMQANGLASRFTVISTNANTLNDVKNKKHIEEFTEKLKADPSFTDLVKQYRQLVNKDADAALVVLNNAHKLDPNNTYVTNELKKY